MSCIVAFHGSGQTETSLDSFVDAIAPGCDRFLPRGGLIEKDGFTFFRRDDDLRIDPESLLEQARVWLVNQHLSEMMLVGYSSGAIFSEALLYFEPDRFSGAILLRPEPIATDFRFPDMGCKPILILSGERDERRTAEAAITLKDQLANANAKVTLHNLSAGHGWANNGEDISLSRQWLVDTGILV